MANKFSTMQCNIYFFVFFDCYCQSLIFQGENVSTQIWDFPNVSLSPKILNLKLFGNSWENSYTKFAKLDITLRFTCGWSDLY